MAGTAVRGRLTWQIATVGEVKVRFGPSKPTMALLPKVTLLIMVCALAAWKLPLVSVSVPSPNDAALAKSSVPAAVPPRPAKAAGAAIVSVKPPENVFVPLRISVPWPANVNERAAPFSPMLPEKVVFKKNEVVCTVIVVLATRVAVLLKFTGLEPVSVTAPSR